MKEQDTHIDDLFKETFENHQMPYEEGAFQAFKEQTEVTSKIPQIIGLVLFLSLIVLGLVVTVEDINYVKENNSQMAHVFFNKNKGLVSEKAVQHSKINHVSESNSTNTPAIKTPKARIDRNHSRVQPKSSIKKNLPAENKTLAGFFNQKKQSALPAEADETNNLQPPQHPTNPKSSSAPSLNFNLRATKQIHPAKIKSGQNLAARDYPDYFVEKKTSPFFSRSSLGFVGGLLMSSVNNTYGPGGFMGIKYGYGLSNGFAIKAGINYQNVGGLKTPSEPISEEIRMHQIDIPLLFHYTTGRNNFDIGLSYAAWLLTNQQNQQFQSSDARLHMGYEFVVTDQINLGASFEYGFFDATSNIAFANDRRDHEKQFRVYMHYKLKQFPVKKASKW